MSADEIRTCAKAQRQLWDNDHFGGTNIEMAAMVWQSEIAAQFAELNQQIRDIANAVLPLKGQS